jgi:DNA-binding transcriptional MerR regulator
MDTEAEAALWGVNELADELGVSARTIRFYEQEGLLAPRRVGNNRVFGRRDRARLLIILRGKRLGFSIKEIREYLELYDADPTQRRQIELLLGKVRARIDALLEQRAACDEALRDLWSIENQAEAALAAKAKEPK